MTKQSNVARSKQWGAEAALDAGFSNVTDCAFWLPLGATLVIGSESLATLGAWKDIHASFGRSVVLSLDFEGESLRGEYTQTSATI